jgi:hypothetical protein
MLFSQFFVTVKVNAYGQESNIRYILCDTMAKQIKVNAGAMEGIVGSARQVPEQRMDEAFNRFQFFFILLSLT